MNKRARHQALTAKMYRHFAVITLLITAAMALVVDTESRAAAEAKIEAVEKNAANERLAMQQKYGQTKFLDNAIDREISESWSDDNGYNGDFGAPMDEQGARADAGGSAGSAFNAAATAPQDLAAFGISAAEIAQMTPEERAEMLRRLHQERYGTSPEQRRRDTRSLMAGSMARSGTSEAEL